MKDEIIKLASELIQVESVKASRNLDVVLQRAEKYLDGFTIERFNSKGVPSLLVYLEKTRPERFKVILNAHLDVVPGKPEQFSPVVRDGKMYGRGTYDMKAAGAVEILVFKELAKQVPYPLALQLVTDEEIGGLHGTRYQVEQGVRADFVIAGEPTNFGVNNKAKGIVWVKITARGEAGHGAYPWQGTNAIWKMKQVLDVVEKNYPVPSEEIWRTTFNLARMETSNTTYNKVPDDCIALFDIRYIPEDKEAVTQFLNEFVSDSISVEYVMNESAQFTDEQDPFVVALRKSVKDVTGEVSPVIVKHGGSDIRLFNAVGCPGITFGPKGYGLHTDEEWVDIGSLEEYYEILKQFLLSLT